jgi:uncharacterized protein (DUF2126 family)/transglutaminase-like putative cysteine protease
LGIRVALHHATDYRYDGPVTLLPHVVRLRPAPHCRAPIESYSLRVQPQPHFIHWQQDPFANYQARITFPKPASELKFEVDLIADITAINPFDFFVESSAEHFPFAYAPSLRRDLAPYLEVGRTGLQFAALVEDARSHEARSSRRTIDVLVDLNRRVQRSIRYDVRMTPGVFTPDETLQRGYGSCRDFAWLLVQILRNLGLAARFVSGYSIQLSADEKPIEGPAGVERDAADLHAWAEVFLPGVGWVGLDATSGLLAGGGHIPLACTPEPETAAAVTGTFQWIGQERVHEHFSFAMSIARILEVPRVTLPYSNDAWQAIDALGRAVDRTLVENDVRLTMGGEPTFVATDDPDSPEWNTEAFGPRKRMLAGRLVHRLYDRFTRGGLLHEGQGKWYPGEPLPRWALSCYFRKDGAPIWSDATLFAQGENGGDGDAEATRFIARLASLLEVEPEFIVPAFEDAWYYLWRERRLPVNVDPLDSRLDDAPERARLARVFEQGLKTVVGYALPLAPAALRGGDTETRWRSEPWFIRSERLCLIPGDSPMGFRLPLDSLPWVAPEERPRLYPPDKFAVFPPLASSAWRPGLPRQDAPAPPARVDSPSGLIRTCLCVEARGGVLHVFMPPLERLEDYLALCACVEGAAASLRQPVRIEGYHPPADPRVDRLQVTPDPGVIEVNIQPAHDWEELVANTVGLYEEARAVGLRAEKFMLDGRHTGTGGGNHIVLGGPTPPDSPVLRRPDLLRSLLGYWLNHPSLSFLFAGLFVGPTSQAPRVDEARNDSLHELEIAFRQVDAASESPPPPWLVDRIFRHLLVDVTGNAHRTEFCIDKLYSPDGPAGRQGLVELRAFEMPPHARMSVAQQLLVRALVARFWSDPYRESLVHWGTAIHDRFALPHFVREDFTEVLEELSRAGFAFDPSWFVPHYEFRFPLLGKLDARGGLVLELRQAIEPWHVLGEEAIGGTTSRYVDSSVERVEVKVQGMTDDRHVLTCNGRRVPLHPTGTNGEFVAGVRYRAWKPPSALHPNVPVHSPLVFDLVDRWNRRAVAGCTYHVMHPGGRAYDLFPSNALEAEGRRAGRFMRAGHSPGTREVPAVEHNPRFPLTLDLRR